MTRSILFFAAFVGLPGTAWASSLAYALDQVDGSPARIELIDRRMLAGNADDTAESWRIRSLPTDPAGGDDGDVRLKVKLRPNRAMGRMSVSF